MTDLATLICSPERVEGRLAMTRNALRYAQGYGMISVLMVLLAALLAFLLTTPAAAQQSRIKDLGTFEGIRTNQLVGYGIVVGLAGTGDDSFEYLTQGMGGIASRFGITLPPGVDPGLKNAAAVLITAELPPLARPGQRIDITVSAIGRARSLRGGTLILAPLQGADGQIYAMAQGEPSAAETPRPPMTRLPCAMA